MRNRKGLAKRLGIATRVVLEPLENRCLLSAGTALDTHSSGAAEPISVTAAARYTHIAFQHSLVVNTSHSRFSDPVVVAKVKSLPQAFSAGDLTVQISGAEPSALASLVSVSGRPRQERIQIQYGFNFNSGIYVVQVSVLFDSNVIKTAAVKVVVRSPVIYGEGAGTIVTAYAGSSAARTLGWLHITPVALQYEYFIIDWGDGSEPDLGATTVKRGHNRYALVGSHQYANAGQYIVRVDSDGNILPLRQHVFTSAMIVTANPGTS